MAVRTCVGRGAWRVTQSAMMKADVCRRVGHSTHSFLHLQTIVDSLKRAHSLSARLEALMYVTTLQHPTSTPCAPLPPRTLHTNDSSRCVFSFRSISPHLQAQQSI